MFQVSRKTEYALLAIGYMGAKGWPGGVTSAREIADAHHIPYSLLAKILQTLAAEGLVRAVHGTKGGYVLAKHPSTITVAETFRIFEGRVAIAECVRDGEVGCPQWDDCSMKDPMSALNQKIQSLFAGLTVADLVSGKGGIKL